MDWPQLTAFGALVAFVLTVGGLLARGKLWTSAQVTALTATYKERAELDQQRIEAERRRADAERDRADMKERDTMAAIAAVGASAQRIETALARRDGTESGPWPNRAGATT